MSKLRFLLVFISLIVFFLMSCSSLPRIIRDEPLRDYQQKGAINNTSESPTVSKSTDELENNNGNENQSQELSQDTQECEKGSGENANVSSDLAGNDKVSNGENQRKVQEQENMDEALELLGQSQILWEKGDLDNALSLLDQAYSLILDVNGEPDIAWQKDDLRFMIAKRILEIYTSRSNVATGYQSAIPFVMNDDVKKEIGRFQRGDRRFFIESCKRSAVYRPIIVAQLEKAGLPKELSWLPLVESGFKIKALSRARALGLWQIIPSTGYKFGLKRDHWIDERMDVEKSTQSAIAYLKALHGIFGDWLTVLAAYNCGEGRVLRVISRQHMNYLDNFWDLYRQLPIETARYVPRFLAALHILKDPEKYGIKLDENKDKPIDHVMVKTTKCMRLQDIARHLNVSEDSLIGLNTELRFTVTPNREYDLKIPCDKAEQFALVVDQIPKSKIPGSARYVRHKVQQGEALSTIARKYRSSVRSIARANHLTSKHRIRAGKWLKIPLRGYSYVDESISEPPHTIAKDSTGNIMNYRVKQGDSLWLLARRFDTRISEIKRLNGLRTNGLGVGQIIRVRSGSPMSSYVVKKGDCIASIAGKNKISIQKLLQINGLSLEDNIYPGQVIIVRR
ncbi:MAG: LysM peptidoglycan-binding domain-containing protein [Deltaproteobacteria bacterium]|nr:LysM peptidoglycan-binding domain-containing protein [Deltaproteobacteria bacterium]